MDTSPVVKHQYLAAKIITPGAKDLAYKVFVQQIDADWYDVSSFEQVHHISPKQFIWAIASDPRIAVAALFPTYYPASFTHQLKRGAIYTPGKPTRKWTIEYHDWEERHLPFTHVFGVTQWYMVETSTHHYATIEVPALLDHVDVCLFRLGKALSPMGYPNHTAALSAHEYINIGQAGTDQLLKKGRYDNLTLSQYPFKGLPHLWFYIIDYHKTFGKRVFLVAAQNFSQAQAILQGDHADINLDYTGWNQVGCATPEGAIKRMDPSLTWPECTYAIQIGEGFNMKIIVYNQQVPQTPHSLWESILI